MNQIAVIDSNSIQTGLGDFWDYFTADWLTNFNSLQTRHAYRGALIRFLFHVKQLPTEITQSDVIHFKEAMVKGGYQQASINQHLSAVSSFFTFAIGRGLCSSNPVDGVKRMTVNPYGKATYLDGQQNEDIAFLKQIPVDTVQGKRDYAIMLIFLTTAIRADGIATLYIRQLRQLGERLFLTFNVKGGKQVEMELKSATAHALLAYLGTRPFLLPSDPIFAVTEAGKLAMARCGIADENKSLSARTVQNLVRKYAGRAFGKGHGITPHSLRHTAAMNAALYGSIAEVSKLLGHSDLRVTTVYLQHMDTGGVDKLTEKLDERYR